MSDLGVITAGVRVLVRVRPLLIKLGEDGQDCGHLTVATNGSGVAVAGNDTKQEDVYKCDGVQDLVPHVLNGYNATIFAYGQTGAGKTYTMGGLLKSESSDGIPEPGVCVRLQHDIFAGVEDTKIKVSITFLQIYQEKVYDQQNQTSGQGNALNVRWSSVNAFHVPELTNVFCDNVAHAIGCYKKGNQKRVVAQHNQNTESSRSHTVFSVHVLKDGQSSVLTVVDQAGSEKVKQTGVQGTTLTQAIGINQSLFVLRKVITGQAAQQIGPNSHIPYRDSVLTKLQKNSLGGNSQTTMIACVNPQRAFAEETQNTLTYANLTAKIVNKAKPVEDEKTSLIRRLQHENKTLREMLERAKDLFMRKSDEEQRASSSSSSSSIIQEHQENREELNMVSSKLKQSIGMTATLLQENQQLSKETTRLQTLLNDSENNIVEQEFDNIELQRQNQFLEQLVQSGGNIEETNSPSTTKHTEANEYKDEINRLRALLTKQDHEIASQHKQYVQNSTTSRPRSNYNSTKIVKRNTSSSYYNNSSYSSNNNHSSRGDKSRIGSSHADRYSVGPSSSSSSGKQFSNVVDLLEKSSMTKVTTNPYLQSNQYANRAQQQQQQQHVQYTPSSHSTQHQQMLQHMQRQMQQQQQKNQQYRE